MKNMDFKALMQFARGNATLFEWSGSPIVSNNTLQGYLLGDKVRQSVNCWM